MAEDSFIALATVLMFILIVLVVLFGDSSQAPPSLYVLPSSF